jgi:hypothetical protein
LKLANTKRAGRLAQVVEHLSSKCKGLSSNSVTTSERETETEREREREREREFSAMHGDAHL